MAALERSVELLANAADRDYFLQHQQRFRHTTGRLQEMLPPRARILDIGSHYLHEASVLSDLGHHVTGLDVSAFSRLPHVIKRASDFGVENRTVEFDEFAGGAFLSGEQNAVDAVLFCEILEHITFNPVRFWRRVYDLLRVGGFIYITTPNGVSLLSLLGALRGLLTLSKVGLNVRQIFGHVTYGHHWKEYTAAELKRYFAYLSPDFHVQIARLHYPGGIDPHADTGLAGRARSAILAAGNATTIFAERLEAVVVLESRTRWLLTPPEYA